MSYQEKYQTIILPILKGTWKVIVLILTGLWIFFYSSYCFAKATSNFLSFRK